MTGFRSTLAIIWRLAIPYFMRSEDRVAGRVLLAAVVALELGVVTINVLINQWNARFYNALQDRAWDAFVSELLYFSVLAVIFIVINDQYISHSIRNLGAKIGIKTPNP